jgi:6-pyruvoyltetrahydropterin/6-carboxytetrahydropterin synthase
VLATSIKTRKMYYVKKRMEISAAHRLKLNYKSKCGNLHGHNWIVTVYCKSQELDENGMVTDFSKIKQRISDHMDHKNLNDVFDFNPTAENIARWICDNVNNCYRVDIAESENNTATYEKD